MEMAGYLQGNTYLAGMMTAFADEPRIAGEGWSLRAERVDVLGDGKWRRLFVECSKLFFAVYISARRDFHGPSSVAAYVPTAWRS